MIEVTLHKRTTKLTESIEHLEGNSYALKASGDGNTGQYSGDNQNQIKSEHRPIYWQRSL